MSKYKALYAALDAAAPDKASWLAGKDAYYVGISAGNTAKNALEAALDSAAPDTESWEKGRVAFYASLDRSPRVIVSLIVAALAFVALMILIFAIIGSQKPATTSPTVPTTTVATASPTPAVIATKAETATNQALQKADWIKNQYIIGGIGKVDESLDKSTTGDLGFNLDGAKASSVMLTYLKSGKNSAETLIKHLMETTGASRDEVLDITNWVVVQSLIDFNYPGNTSFQNERVVNAGARKGSAGDIFFAFVSKGQVVFVRGACANPQTVVPKPQPKPTPTNKPKPTPKPTLAPKPTPKPTLAPKPTPKPTLAPKPTPTSKPATKLQPKSSNPADYKKPGDDKKTDAGTGTKPPVPTVSTPAELNPPTVNTVVPTKAIVAPGATPLPTQAPKATPTPTLAPEPSVNPTDGTPNSGDPGNPFG